MNGACTLRCVAPVPVAKHLVCAEHGQVSGGGGGGSASNNVRKQLPVGFESRLHARKSDGRVP